MKNKSNKVDDKIKNHLDEWLTTKETCEKLKISERTLSNIKQKRRLPFAKVGGTIRYHIEDLNSLIKESYNGRK